MQRYFPKPFIETDKSDKRIVSFFETTTSTAPPQHGGRSTTTTTTTTTTRPSEERVIGPQQGNVVLNVFYNQSVSPYLNGEKDENRCEEILGKLRGDVQNEGRDWNLFDDVGNLGEVMICNIVYGWALGEYCASGFDEVNAPYLVQPQLKIRMTLKYVSWRPSLRQLQRRTEMMLGTSAKT